MAEPLIEVQVTGQKEVAAKLRVLAKTEPEKMSKGLYNEGLLVAKRSMQLTPVDTGALRASHEVEQPKKDGDSFVVAIKVGGPTAPYAPIVHFDVTAHHTVGEALFLQKAVMEALPYMAARVAGMGEPGGLGD